MAPICHLLIRRVLQESEILNVAKQREQISRFLQGREGLVLKMLFCTFLTWLFFTPQILFGGKLFRFLPSWTLFCIFCVLVVAGLTLSLSKADPQKSALFKTSLLPCWAVEFVKWLPHPTRLLKKEKGTHQFPRKTVKLFFFAWGGDIWLQTCKSSGFIIQLVTSLIHSSAVLGNFTRHSYLLIKLLQSWHFLLALRMWLNFDWTYLVSVLVGRGSAVCPLWRWSVCSLLSLYASQSSTLILSPLEVERSAWQGVDIHERKTSDKHFCSRGRESRLYRSSSPQRKTPATSKVIFHIGERVAAKWSSQSPWKLHYLSLKMSLNHLRWTIT